MGVGNIHSVIGKAGGFTRFATDNEIMKKPLKLAQVLQRELKGRVISKVAKEIGLGVSLLHDWHSSARAPSARNMDQARKLAHYLGLTLEELLFDERTDREVISSTSFTDRGIQYRVNIERLRKGDPE
jgi:transcriptional regulator with XRE-family HTH domain